MISTERALAYIGGRDLGQVRKFIYERIMGIDISFSGSGHSTEAGEDVVIQLLSDSGIGAEKRLAVIDGWLDAYREVRDWLDDSDYVREIDTWKGVVVRLCRVADVAGPPEIRKYVKRLVDEMLGEDECPRSLLVATVKAYMAYAQDKKSVRFWEEEVLANKDVAAYGFNALLEIDARHERIEKHLCELWRLQVEKNWPVRTAFLLRRAARIRNQPALIYRVLWNLKNKGYYLWEEVAEELEQQPWTREWLERVNEFEPQIRKLTETKQVSASWFAGKDIPETTLDAESFSKAYAEFFEDHKKRFLQSKRNEELKRPDAWGQLITWPELELQKRQEGDRIRQMDAISGNYMRPPVSACLPQAYFIHGLNQDSVSEYIGHLVVKSHPSDLCWIDHIDQLVQVMDELKYVNLSTQTNERLRN